jgi:hypothetical protein
MACIFLFMSPRLVPFFLKRFKFYFEILFQFILFILHLKPWFKFESIFKSFRFEKSSKSCLNLF